MDDYTQQPNNWFAKNKNLIIKIAIIVLAAFVIISSLLIGYKYMTKSKTPGQDNGSLFPTVTDIVNLVTGKDETSTSTPITSSDGKLVEIYKGPIGGYIFLNDGETVRLFDRAKGLIVDVNIKTNEQKIVTDQPLLHVHDVVFINDLTIITRSLEDNTIKSNLYTFSLNTDTGILSQIETPTTLSDNILELAKSKNGKYVVLVVKDITGSNIDVLNTQTNDLKRKISLPISEWLPFVTDNGEVILSSKASKYADSGSYKIVNGTLSQVVFARRAQTSSISNNAKRVLSFSIYDNNIGQELVEKDTDGNYIDSDNNAGISTLAEKCAWNKFDTIIICGNPNTISKDIPDDWYLGKESYSDSIYQYNIITQKTDELTNFMANGIDVDIINPEVRDNLFIFENKKDEHLFIYKLDNSVDIEINESDIQNDNNAQ